MEKWLRIDSPLGCLTLTERDERIAGLSFGAVGKPTEESRLLREAARQLGAYFDGKLFRFELPLLLRGTPFQCAVWNALCEIPYGETRSYAEIARAAGCPKAYRAVGAAVHVNPIPIIVPCHRVIGADGSAGGYFAGLQIKRELLMTEGISIGIGRNENRLPFPKKGQPV